MSLECPFTVTRASPADSHLNVTCWLLLCSSYVYLMNVTIAGYGTGTGYPGSNQALKVRLALL